jgi:hypothetical protein
MLIAALPTQYFLFLLFIEEHEYSTHCTQNDEKCQMQHITIVYITCNIILCCCVIQYLQCNPKKMENHHFKSVCINSTNWNMKKNNENNPTIGIYRAAISVFILGFYKPFCYNILVQNS